MFISKRQSNQHYERPIVYNLLYSNDGKYCIKKKHGLHAGVHSKYMPQYIIAYRKSNLKEKH